MEGKIMSNIASGQVDPRWLSSGLWSRVRLLAGLLYQISQCECWYLPGDAEVRVFIPGKGGKEEIRLEAVPVNAGQFFAITGFVAAVGLATQDEVTQASQRFPHLFGGCTLPHKREPIDDGRS